MFRHQHAYQETLPYSIDTAPNSRALERAVRAIESLDLDPQRVVLVGSAALAAYGIELGDNRPHDADLTVPGSLFRELNDSLQTPSGQPLKRKIAESNSMQSILVAPPLDEDTMSVDIISRFNPARQSVAANEAGFRTHYSIHSHKIPDTNVSVASLDHLKNELKRRSIKDPDAWYDYRWLTDQLPKLK